MGCRANEPPPKHSILGLQPEFQRRHIGLQNRFQLGGEFLMNRSINPRADPEADYHQEQRGDQGPDPELPPEQRGGGRRGLGQAA